MDTTELLRSARRGDKEAVDQLYEHVYQELRRLARVQLGGRHGDTLNTAALVNEAYLKLADATRLDVRDRNHFLALSARAMRQILVDHFRSRGAEKRGGNAVPVTFVEDQVPMEQRGDAILALDAAMQSLSKENQRLAQVVEYKFFGGMSYEEIAAVLGVASRTVRRDWLKAKAWLLVTLRDSGQSDE